jgi:hypothetical protein
MTEDEQEAMDAINELTAGIDAADSVEELRTMAKILLSKNLMIEASFGEAINAAREEFSADDFKVVERFTDLVDEKTTEGLEELRIRVLSSMILSGLDLTDLD